jgi:prepilin-type processing-associated H-X9-DG protein
MSIIVTCVCGQRFEAPEASAGSLVQCQNCSRDLPVPKPTPPGEELFDFWDSGRPRTSGKSIASLILGMLFFLTCLTGLPAILFGRRALRDIDLSKGRLRGRWMAITGIVLGVIGCLLTIALFLPALRSTREAARRAQCTNNLKQIGLALQNYESAYGCLPPAAITDEAGTPLLSWRVLILPFLDSSMLRFDLRYDEPWDSPHNLKLLERMPYVYTCPSDMSLQPGMTGYQAIIGHNTAFARDSRPVPFGEITDGLSQTLMISESTHTVPWTKPEDVRFDTKLGVLVLSSHHGYHNNGFNALFADGSVRFLKSSIDPDVIRALATRNGNEKVSSDNY